MNKPPRLKGADANGQPRGRIRNQKTGLGTSRDRSLPTEFFDVEIGRDEAETLYRMSWAARKMVRILVDDMFAAGRRWVDKDDGKVREMKKAVSDLKAMAALQEAMVAGRLFGTAVLFAVPSDGSWDKDLKPEDVKEGSIANLLVVDRWSLSVKNWQVDPRKPNYAQPYQFQWNGRAFGSPSPESTSGAPSELMPVPPLTVNASRTMRFDGIRSPLTEGWIAGPWSREWGVSILTPAVDEINRDAAIHAAAGHLVQESSVWVQKIQGFRDSLKGRQEPGEPTAEEIAEEVNALRSIYKTQFMDVDDEAERVQVQFAGLAQILDYEAKRLAAIEGIPVTRFLGTSATGLNATGEGDARDWRITIAAAQRRLLDPVLADLDMIVAKHAGLDEPPEYEWLPLGEMTDQEKAELSFRRTEAVNLTYAAGLISEDRALEQLGKDEEWGEMGSWEGPNEATKIPDLPPGMQSVTGKGGAQTKPPPKPPPKPAAKPGSKAKK